jgi:hypothetical protein
MYIADLSVCRALWSCLSAITAMISRDTHIHACKLINSFVHWERRWNIHQFWRGERAGWPVAEETRRMLQRAASNAYSWWWASHIRTRQSKWLDSNLQGLFVVLPMYLDFITSLTHLWISLVKTLHDVLHKLSNKIAFGIWSTASWLYRGI